MSEKKTVSVESVAKPLLSSQGLDLPSPARGQLHRLAADGAPFDAFAYVIAAADGMCDVMLGSKDAMMASAMDIVLPPSVLGDYVMLFLGLRAKVPVKSLGRGFASLVERVCGKIDQAIKKFSEGKDDLGFVRGYPFVSMLDDRIAYRVKMSQCQALMKNRRWAPFVPSMAFERTGALAASDAVRPVVANCRVPGFDGLVNVRYTPADKQLRLQVFSSDGSRSEALDGWGVFGSDSSPLGTIEGSAFVCEVGDGFDGVLGLVGKDGAVAPLSGDSEGARQE